MKRIAVLLLITAMSVSLIACTNKQEKNEGKESVQESSEQPEEGTEEALQDEEMTGNTLSAEMTNIRQAVVDALGENYWPQMMISAEYLEEYGLTAEMYEEFFGEMPMISTNVDTLIIIKAKDGQAEAVEEVLNAYRENLVNDTMQYPMNVGKINASEVKKFGNFICYVQLGADVMEASEKGDEEVIKHCQAQNAIAIEALENTIGK